MRNSGDRSSVWAGFFKLNEMHHNTRTIFLSEVLADTFGTTNLNAANNWHAMCTAAHNCSYTFKGHFQSIFGQWKWQMHCLQG